MDQATRSIRVAFSVLFIFRIGSPSLLSNHGADFSARKRGMAEIGTVCRPKGSVAYVRVFLRLGGAVPYGVALYIIRALRRCCPQGSVCVMLLILAQLT